MRRGFVKSVAVGNGGWRRSGLKINRGGAEGYVWLERVRCWSWDGVQLTGCTISATSSSS